MMHSNIFWNLVITRELSAWEPASVVWRCARWPILCCRPTQEPRLATDNEKTSGEILEKMKRELVLWAQSTTKGYIRAEHKLHSISKLLISQVIIPQVMFKKTIFFSLVIFRGHSTQEPASSRVSHFILRAYTGTGVGHSQHRKKSGDALGKMQVNGPEG